MPTQTERPKSAQKQPEPAEALPPDKLRQTASYTIRPSEQAYREQLISSIALRLGEASIGYVQTSTLALLNELMGAFESNRGDGSIDELIKAFQSELGYCLLTEPAPNDRDEESEPDSGWVDNTPDPQTYCIVMYDSDGGSAQEIDMTRSEFIALKKQLAVMRQFQPKAATQGGAQ